MEAPYSFKFNSSFVFTVNCSLQTKLYFVIIKRTKQIVISTKTTQSDEEKSLLRLIVCLLFHSYGALILLDILFLQKCCPYGTFRNKISDAISIQNSVSGREKLTAER